MREIKFRAWDSWNKQMLYPETQEDGSSMVIRCLSGKVGFEWDSEGGGGVEDNEYLIPMQYTGIKDKNGKEIYEGDIVLAATENTREKWRVEYDFSSCAFLLFRKLTHGDTIIMFDKINHGEDGIEKIGNVHENAALLGRDERGMG